MKRLLSLFVAILMVLTMLPAFPAFAEDVYAETELKLPDGYQSPGALTQTPDGGFAAAAKDASGAWALIRWTALGAEPSVLPLKYEGNGIGHLSIAPDGSILVSLGFMSQMAAGTAAAKDAPATNETGASGEASKDAPVVRQAGTSGEAPKDAPVVKQAGTSGEAPKDAPVVKQAGASGEAPKDAPVVKQAGASGEAPENVSVVEGGAGTGANTSEASVAGKGRVLINPDDLKNTLVWFDPSGAEVASFEAAGYVTGVQALGGYQAAVLTARNGLAVLDQEGKQLSQIGLGTAQAAVFNGTALYALEDSKLNKYDAATGDKLGSMDLVMEGSGVLTSAPDGKLYLVDVSGLYQLDFQSGAKTEITSSMGMAFGDPTNSVSALACLSDGSFAVLLGAGGGNVSSGKANIRIGGVETATLMGYQKCGDIDASQRTDFTITALRDSTRLQKAASDFQRAHPELNVKLQTQMSIDDASPADEHIRTLNTDLLAGKGGDVLVLDGLPYDKYAEKGMLTDLSGTFQNVNLLPGIRKAVTGQDGSMFYIPAQFSFDLLWGSKASIGAFTSLKDLPDIALPDGQTPLFPRKYEDWLKLFYPANEPLFENEAGKPELDAPAFADFLDALYKLYENQGELPDENVVKLDGSSPDAILAMLNGSTALYEAPVNSLMNLTIGYTISGAADGAFSTVPTLDGPSRGFSPSLMLGIGSQSKNKPLAEEFIRLALSPEVQQLEQTEGLPTVAESLDKMFADAAERAKDGKSVTMLSLEGGNPIEMKQPDEKTLSALRALIDTLDRQIIPDETLMGFIVEECDGFFAGRQDAAATAAAIGQRAWSYLNE